MMLLSLGILSAAAVLAALTWSTFAVVLAIALALLGILAAVAALTGDRLVVDDPDDPTRP